MLIWSASSLMFGSTYNILQPYNPFVSSYLFHKIVYVYISIYICIYIYIYIYVYIYICVYIYIYVYIYLFITQMPPSFVPVVHPASFSPRRFYRRLRLRVLSGQRSPWRTGDEPRAALSSTLEDIVWLGQGSWFVRETARCMTDWRCK